ncbi:hypothetical protein llap_4862 [Limosa lapponica baueri]|uniref:Uncharacterized protein n=1 Tax=Limosa lapponica baueri TaxID=1758121 RepID=A0A2I0UFM8_LIMLA|nr:hypothetical protein llap_4862 [Limosa lapponica baueri]
MQNSIPCDISEVVVLMNAMAEIERSKGRTEIEKEQSSHPKEPWTDVGRSPLNLGGDIKFVCRREEKKERRGEERRGEERRGEEGSEEKRREEKKKGWEKRGKKEAKGKIKPFGLRLNLEQSNVDFIGLPVAFCFQIKL